MNIWTAQYLPLTGNRATVYWWASLRSSSLKSTILLTSQLMMHHLMFGCLVQCIVTVHKCPFACLLMITNYPKGSHSARKNRYKGLSQPERVITILNISLISDTVGRATPKAGWSITLTIKHYNVDTVYFVLSYHFLEQAWPDTLKAKRKTAVFLLITSIMNLYIVPYFSNPTQHRPIRVQATMERAMMNSEMPSWDNSLHTSESQTVMCFPFLFPELNQCTFSFSLLKDFKRFQAG